MSKNLKTVLSIIIVLVVIFLIALPKLPLFKEESNATPSETQARSNKAVPVRTISLKTQSLDNEIKVTGAILANESIELASEISGKISGIYFKEGDNVKKGEVLIKINDEDLRAQLEKLKYTKQLNENMESRMSQLLKRDAISQEEYDISLTELQTSSADINVLQAQIDKATIKAPFAGVIGLRYVSEGSYIAPSTLIATLYNIDPAKIEFSVPGKYSSLVTRGDNISFTTEGSEELFAGEVYATEPKIDPVTRTLLVRAISPNKQNKLIPGQFVRISLNLGRNEEAIMVPSIAIIPEADGHLVYLVRDGKADSVKVKIGKRTAQEVEIVSGVNVGDSLVISGVQQIKDGTVVQVLPDKQ